MTITITRWMRGYAVEVDGEDGGLFLNYEGARGRALELGACFPMTWSGPKMEQFVEDDLERDRR